MLGKLWAFKEYMNEGASPQSHTTSDFTPILCRCCSDEQCPLWILIMVVIAFLETSPSSLNQGDQNGITCVSPYNLPLSLEISVHCVFHIVHVMTLNLINKLISNLVVKNICMTRYPS